MFLYFPFFHINCYLSSLRCLSLCEEKLDTCEEREDGMDDDEGEGDEEEDIVDDAVEEERGDFVSIFNDGGDGDEDY